jgi:hypothetical protein
VYLGEGIILKACRYSLLTSTWLFSLSYPLSATVTEIGRISDALMTRGEKSFVSCLVGARLILIVLLIEIIIIHLR